MKHTMKEKIAQSLSHNQKLDKRLLKLKSSLDEVSKTLSSDSKRRK